MITLSSPAFLFGTIAVVAILIVISFAPSCKLAVENFSCYRAWPGPNSPDIGRCDASVATEQCASAWGRIMQDDQDILFEIDYDNLSPPCDQPPDMHQTIRDLQPVQEFESHHKTTVHRILPYGTWTPTALFQSEHRYLEPGYRSDKQDFASYYTYGVMETYTNDPLGWPRWGGAT